MLSNNYLQVCQCDICQANDFKTCGGGKEFKGFPFIESETTATETIVIDKTRRHEVGNGFIFLSLQ